ncbi:MAG: hypothetical protein ACP5PT_04980 [Brevinematia bacterium]
MRNKGLPYLVVLLFSLILSNLSYALTGYKTGLPIDQYYLYSATWDGNQWKVSTTLMKVTRDPSYGLNVKAENPLVITYGSALPSAPKQDKGWYLSSSGGYASELNNALQKILPGILKSQNDTSSRVVADLAIRTSDGKEVHYIATYDGNNGYRSYGFQASAPNFATFVYYSKKFDSKLPPPPSSYNPPYYGDVVDPYFYIRDTSLCRSNIARFIPECRNRNRSSSPKLIQNRQAQNNLGKYYYIIFRPNGEIIEQNTVDVNGEYDSTDDTGLNKFINEVVLPTMRKNDVGLSIVRYMHNIRLTLDKNGKYQYYVSVPYREVGTNCQEMGGYYDASTGKCKVKTPCYDASGNPKQPINWNWRGHPVPVCPVVRHFDPKVYGGFNYTGTVRVPDGANLVLGYLVDWACDDDWTGYWLYVWNASSGQSLYVREGECNIYTYDYIVRNAVGLTVSYDFHDVYDVGGFDYYDFVFGWEVVDKEEPAYAKSMYEKIAYNYATEADVKVYAVSINGDRQFLGYKPEAGYSFNFTVNKRRSDLFGYQLSPNYFIDKIISIRNNVFDIVRYKDEGVKDVGSLVIK